MKRTLSPLLRETTAVMSYGMLWQQIQASQLASRRSHV